jgi:hypothetical protein
MMHTWEAHVLATFFDWLREFVVQFGTTQVIGGIVLWILVFVLLGDARKRWLFFFWTIGIAAVYAIIYG